MNKVEEEMRAQQHKELVQKFFAHILGAGMANMKHNHPDAAWVDRELEGIQDVLGNKRSDKTA